MGGLDFQHVGLVTTHTPSGGVLIDPAFPTVPHISLTAQIYAELAHFSAHLWPAPLITCLDQCILLCPGPWLLSLPLGLFARQQPEGACKHLSQAVSLLCSEPSVAPNSLRGKARDAPPGPPSDLPLYPSPIVLQRQWPPCCSLNIPYAFLPQGLCTGCLSCPDPSGSPFTFRPQLKSQLLKKASPHQPLS